ncbi:hypothetical protein OHC33_006474 [Knufia fluminis]|uniref:Glycosyl transferase CAP10 domain-containing protein n=1 Tax=Knufia fluminis TaxID=191047 RepID=A0AAN8I6X8_9EURO|nr:hypothetical protein OHC33_006474 [Knufia fluminis]
MPKWTPVDEMNNYYNTYRPHGEKALTLLARRPALIVTAVVGTFLLLIWHRSNSPASLTALAGGDRRTDFDGHWNFSRDRNNLLLDYAQCEDAFPKLFDEVERAVNLRRSNHITSAELDAIEPKNGYVRAMVYDQELYIIQKQGGIYSRELATLHAIQRAIYSSPNRLPNIEFAFNTDDIIFEAVPLWGYARKAEHQHVWLMPDFGYWSWPETKVGTMREVQMKAAAEENVHKYSWHNKVEKLLWRGATMGLPLRDRLVEITKDQPWADVVALDWHNKDSMQNDLKSMPEHCDYKYLAHTEGNSYSGRLKYLQACQSVIVAHKMDWIQHHHPLMSSTGPDQNFVEINRDFGNLEATITNFRKNDRQAENIATNNVKTFRERYLTPAAEACYWRRLIRGWAEVSFEPEFYKTVNGTKEWRGLPFESFALERRLEWDPY